MTKKTDAHIAKLQKVSLALARILTKEIGPPCQNRYKPNCSKLRECEEDPDFDWAGKEFCWLRLIERQVPDGEDE